MELDKDDLKPGITVHEKKSLLHPRINSQLPAILSDPDSDSNKLFKKTQWSHPLVARGTVTLSPHHPSGAPLQQKPNLFKHPIAMSTMKRNSFTVQPEVHQMTSKALQEIVTGTKGISVIAARKRSQVPISDFSHDLKKGREPRVMSVHHLEDNDRKFQERSRSEPRFVLKSNVQQASSMQDLTSPSHHARVNGKMLSQPLTSNSNYSRKATQKAEQKEGSLKGKARKKRSRSLEGHSQGLLKSKHQPSSNTDHRLLNVSTSSSPFPPSKVTSTPSDETASSTRVRFPITHYKGESPLLTLEASNTPPTTIHQRNANGKKRQVLHKQVRGPAETGSTQQLLIHPGNVKKGSQGGVKNRGVNDRVTNRNGNTIKK
ncbi:kinesin-like protein KIF19 [Protopterus annectens]|uniref:kinesin-like protein KIF19 n=1 Tax=Protopterus annectens TaxID=7888 RepID=UPI001CFBD32B|nr:kinesin-like protein KIF19 [Protopterus annectens]